MSRTADSDGLLLLWLSKDRALQLSEAIRTFTRFAELPRDGHVKHVVLYSYSSAAHSLCYTSLASALPHIAFIDELCAPRSSDNAPLLPTSETQYSYFAAHLRAIVDESTEQFVLLCVDDALFISHFSLSHIFPLFASSALLAYHLALHPKLSFHHPSSSPLTLPTFSLTADSSPHSSLLFAHSGGAGSHDFRYPFSLVASIYRLADVRCIVHDLSGGNTGQLPFHHPNLLESSSNTLITTHSTIPAAVRAFLPPPSPSDSSALSTVRPLSALPSRPVCVVVTVNRVQDVYENGVYESVDGAVGAMLQRYEAGGWQLDEDEYGEMAAHGCFTSVHVGELLWKQREVEAANRQNESARR